MYVIGVVRWLFAIYFLMLLSAILLFEEEKQIIGRVDEFWAGRLIVGLLRCRSTDVELENNRN